MENIKNKSEENNFEPVHDEHSHSEDDYGHVHKRNNDDCSEHVNGNHHDGHHCCEHNHEHDDCGNSHKHHHEHDNCCGHDHNEQGHDHPGHDDCEHSNEHEHHHEHSHGHTYDVPGFLTFESHTHEGATICSFEKQSGSDYDEACEKINTAIIKLRDELNSEGHIIGHLKGFIKQNGEVTTFSTVGADLTVQKHPGAGLQISFAAIVFGPDEEALKDRLADCFAGI